MARMVKCIKLGTEASGGFRNIAITNCVAKIPAKTKKPFVRLFNTFEGMEAVVESENKMSRVTMTARDWKRSVPAWLRGTVIGTPFGCIPAGGTRCA